MTSPTRFISVIDVEKEEFLFNVNSITLVRISPSTASTYSVIVYIDGDDGGSRVTVNIIESECHRLRAQLASL